MTTYRRSWRVTLCRTLAVAVGLSLCEVSASMAAVAGTPLMALSNAALRLTAYGGYVVFSQHDAAGGWQLIAWHDGSAAPLDVAERTVPFDANAGPSADGAPVVVFSKCEHESSHQPMAAGCHVYELALPDGTARLVRGIDAHGASDTTPAIWMGNVAFARRSPGSRVPRLFVWNRASGRLEKLSPGPSTCPALGGALGGSFCARAHRDLSVGVEAMSLDANALSYQWLLPEDRENPFGAPFAEIRVDPLRDARQDGPSRVVSESILGGACNGTQSGSPDAAGTGVLYISHGSACVEEPVLSTISSYTTSTRERSHARVNPGLAVAVAQDHRFTYWIRLTYAYKGKLSQPCNSTAEECGPEPESYAQTCVPAISACTLMRTENLASDLISEAKI